MKFSAHLNSHIHIHWAVFPRKGFQSKRNFRWRRENEFFNYIWWRCVSVTDKKPLQGLRRLIWCCNLISFMANAPIIIIVIKVTMLLSRAEQRFWELHRIFNFSMMLLISPLDRLLQIFKYFLKQPLSSKEEGFRTTSTVRIIQLGEVSVT